MAFVDCPLIDPSVPFEVEIALFVAEYPFHFTLVISVAGLTVRVVSVQPVSVLMC